MEKPAVESKKDKLKSMLKIKVKVKVPLIGGGEAKTKIKEKC